MIVAHHRSLLRYAWRTSTGRDRWWLPLVVVGLLVRTALLCVRHLVQRLVQRTRRRWMGASAPVV
jgi:hypothetical protein